MIGHEIGRSLSHPNYPPKWHIGRKDFVYIPDQGCYTETICPITYFGGQPKAIC